MLSWRCAKKMGNKNDKTQHISGKKQCNSIAADASASCKRNSFLEDSELQELFCKLSIDGKFITVDNLTKCVDSEIASALLRGLCSNFTKDEFVALCKTISDADPIDFYSDCFFKSKNGLVTPDAVLQFLRLCSKGVCIECRDDEFLHVLSNALIDKAESISLQEFRLSLKSLCPRICDDLQQSVIYGLKNQARWMANKTAAFHSTLLSEVEFWWLTCHVAPFYLTINRNCATEISRIDSQRVIAPWQLLYDCQEHGLSVNRFESKVFNYRSPTITLVKMDDGRIFCIGVDEEWKYSPQSWGGRECFLTQFLPNCAKLCCGAGLIYFNTKVRSGQSGLFIGGSDKKNAKLSISPDFSNVLHIEVWGCGPPAILASQEKQKLWEKHQAEKHAKVPLPGNWDENADRALLELAGKTTAHAER